MKLFRLPDGTWINPALIAQADVHMIAPDTRRRVSMSEALAAALHGEEVPDDEDIPLDDLPPTTYVVHVVLAYGGGSTVVQGTDVNVDGDPWLYREQAQKWLDAMLHTMDAEITVW